MEVSPAEPEELLSPEIEDQGALSLLSEWPTLGPWEQEGLCHKGMRTRILNPWCTLPLTTGHLSRCPLSCPLFSRSYARLSTESRCVPAFSFRGTLVDVAIKGQMDTVPRCAGQKGIFS